MWVALMDVAMPSSGEIGEDAISWLEKISQFPLW